MKQTLTIFRRGSTKDLRQMDQTFNEVIDGEDIRNILLMVQDDSKFCLRMNEVVLESKIESELLKITNILILTVKCLDMVP